MGCRSLINDCSRLPFTTQGRSRRLTEGCFLESEWGAQKDLVPRRPTGPCTVSVIFSSHDVLSLLNPTLKLSNVMHVPRLVRILCSVKAVSLWGFVHYVSFCCSALTLAGLLSITKV